jgi:tripartite-type tricarboxylate transporter receptor subunit TctC
MGHNRPPTPLSEATEVGIALVPPSEHAMKIPRRRFLHLAAGAAAMPAFSRIASAQAYPARPIRLVIPFPPGGSNDAVGRPWAEKVKPSLGTVVVENIGGASGALGAAAVARARPDGYTLLFGSMTTHLILPLVSKHLSYDPIKDFEPIALLASNTVTIVVAPSLPVRTLTELVDYAKSNPGKLSYGTPGVGTGQHIIGEQFKILTGLNDIVHVPYRSVGTLTSDFISGQIPIAITTMNGQIAELNASGGLRCSQ